MHPSRIVRVGVIVLSLGVLVTGSVAFAGAASAAHPALPALTFGTSVNSTNWGGYAVSSTSKFTEVTGSWVEPAVVGSCPSSARYASFWVGIDGYTSKTVEQIGTDSDCTGGSPSYYAWYEMYPAGSVSIRTLTIHAGDLLTGEVKVTGTSFALSLKDSTSGGTFSITKTGSGLKQSSAEWIAEAPEICGATCKIAKLNDFGTLRFIKCEAAVGGGALQAISAFTTAGSPHKITMVNSAGTKIRALPSALGSSGASFTMRWKSA